MSKNKNSKQTQEVLDFPSENQNGRLFQVVQQSDVPRVYEEIGEPLQVSFCQYRDLKSRVMEMMKVSHPSHIFNPEDDEDDEDDILQDMDRIDSSEVEDFNSIMSSTPYSVDAQGVANYEKALTKNKEELKQFRHYMSLKDDPSFQQLASLFNGSESKEEILERIKSLSSKLEAESPKQASIPNLSNGDSE